MASKAGGPAADWRAPRLTGKRFVFTGVGHWRREMVALARREGAEVLPALTASADYLVVASHPGREPRATIPSDG